MVTKISGAADWESAVRLMQESTTSTPSLVPYAHEAARECKRKLYPGMQEDTVNLDSFFRMLLQIDSALSQFQRWNCYKSSSF